MSRFFILLLLSFFTSTIAQSKTIAVVDFDANGITASEASTLTEKLRCELMRTNKYQIVERGQMKLILKEQGFQQTGCSSSECVVEMGQLLGVSEMFAGSIGKLGSIYLITLRMIDVNSGLIRKNVDVDIEGNLTDVLRKGIPQIAYKISGLGTYDLPQESNNGITTKSRNVSDSVYKPIRSGEHLKKTARLTITSNIEHAKILLDNTRLDTIPVTQYIPVGIHTIVAQQNGCSDFFKTIILKEGMDSTIAVKFRNPYGIFGGIGWLGGGAGLTGYAISFFVFSNQNDYMNTGSESTSWIIAGVASSTVSVLFYTLGIRKLIQHSRWKVKYLTAIGIEPEHFLQGAEISFAW